MSVLSVNQSFPFNPEYMSWEDWNGNFIVWYGQEPIAHETEDNWQDAAEQISTLPTFASYPIPGPANYASWQDWAKDVTEIINGTSR